jgi:S-formylglutathione hydrolase FrmB
MPTYHDFRGNKTLPGTPDQFRQMIKTVQSLPGEAMSKDVRKLIFVTSFNEWWEGTTVEPAKEYGHTYLDVIREFAERRAQFELVDSSPSGEIVHTVECAYQKGKTKIRVLLPAKMRNAKRRYPVVYVLPVEPLDQSRFGDGLTEIKKLNLHNKHKAIFVAPTFSDLPWYCDHPTQPTKRQERYFTDVVVPYVERTYPCVTEPNGRHLLGFSKSGWGAWTLLLRHPDTFGKAAAWDAPLMMDKPNKYGMGSIFGTQENFEKFQISKLLKAKAKNPGKSKRLIHIGYGNFRSHHEKIEALLKKLAIPHTYVDGPKLKHDWHSGWVAKAVEALTQ